MKLKIAVCDDDKYALESECGIIGSVLSEKEIDHSIQKFNSPEELMKSELDYNIVFLDIEMGDVNGIRIAQALREINNDCLVFFVTNYEKYLDEAFNQHAFRFWTKPIDRHKLIYGIESALNELHNPENSIDVVVDTHTIKIMVDNIIYIYAQDKIAYIVTTKGKIAANETYKNVYEKLQGYSYFCETHRGNIVNLKYVKNYSKELVYCVYKDKTYDVYLSRRKYDNFSKKFLEWIGGK